VDESSAAYRVANVFDCFSNFPATLAEAFLNIAAGIICSTLGLEFIVVDRPAKTFFGSAFYLIEFSFYLISIW